MTILRCNMPGCGKGYNTDLDPGAPCPKCGGRNFVELRRVWWTETLRIFFQTGFRVFPVNEHPKCIMEAIMCWLAKAACHIKAGRLTGGE